MGRTKRFIVSKYFPNVGTSFSYARNFVIFDSMDSGIIGRQSQEKFAIVKVQQMPQLLGASANILNGIIGVAYTQRGCGSRR